MHLTITSCTQAVQLGSVVYSVWTFCLAADGFCLHKESLKNHTQDSAKNVSSSSKMSSASGVGLCPLTPTAVADKNGGPRAWRIQVGHGHAAPFLIDMFVYHMITPYCTKFDNLPDNLPDEASPADTAQPL